MHIFVLPHLLSTHSVPGIGPGVEWLPLQHGGRATLSAGGCREGEVDRGLAGTESLCAWKGFMAEIMDSRFIVESGCWGTGLDWRSGFVCTQQTVDGWNHWFTWKEDTEEEEERFENDQHLGAEWREKNPRQNQERSCQGDGERTRIVSESSHPRWIPEELTCLSHCCQFHFLSSCESLKNNGTISFHCTESSDLAGILRSDRPCLSVT